MRVILPLANATIFVLSIFGFAHHLRRLLRIKRVSSKLGVSSSLALVKILCLGCCIEMVASALRCAFCAVGPMFSTSTLTVVAVSFFFYICVALNVLSTLVATSLLLKLGAFGESKTFLRRHLRLFLMVLGFVFSVIALSMAIVQVPSVLLL